MRTALVLPLVALAAGLAAQERPTPAAPSPQVAAPGASDRAAGQALVDQAQIANHQVDHVHFDRPRADGPLWALGRAWKASFDGDGSTVIPFFGSTAPQNFPLRLSLAKVQVGGEALPLVAGEPVREGDSVRTHRGQVTEIVDTRLESLEQSFVFDTLPNRGAIDVDVAIATELAPSTIEGGLRFANDYGHVDYTKAVAVDAKGERLPLAITWTGSAAHMSIPASFVEHAQLPIVLDPVLNYWFGLGSNPAQLQHDSDVAAIQGGSGRTLIVYQRQWSATDQDCWGILFDADLNLVQTDFALDFTSEDWLKVATAGSNFAQNFLVVAEVRIGLVWFIAGRGVDTNAVLGAEFDIERDGVVGSGGNNFHPDVGSDPYYGVGRYTVVFNKQQLGVSDIYFRQVTTSGALVTANPIALDTATTNETRPSISKSCGQSNGFAANWLVTWQRTWPNTPNDEEVEGRFINWNGALPGSVFGIATSVLWETAPSPSSPIDVGGARYWPVCFEIASSPGQPRDVIGRLMRGDGTTQGAFTVSNGVPGADDREPEIDSDGTRFIACLTTGTAGFPQGVEAVTFAYLPGTSTFRVEERSGMTTSSLDNYGQCNICASYSGGSTMTPRYYISFGELSTNTMRLEAFGGFTGGTTYFSAYPTQCGTPTIAGSGIPAIGQDVTFTVTGAPLTGTILGFPGLIPLNALGCNCVVGVDQGIFLSSPLVWHVPNDPVYVGITLSCQGWGIGSQCLTLLDFTDTLDFTVR